MNFLKELISATSIYSSKRFISIICLLILILILISDLWFPINDIIYYTLTGLILGNGTMTLLQKKG